MAGGYPLVMLHTIRLEGARAKEVPSLKLSPGQGMGHKYMR
jgi:hypothetical protein